MVLWGRCIWCVKCSSVLRAVGDEDGEREEGDAHVGESGLQSGDWLSGGAGTAVWTDILGLLHEVEIFVIHVHVVHVVQGRGGGGLATREGRGKGGVACASTHSDPL